MKKKDELLNAEIKICDEGESGIEMTAEERRLKKEEEEKQKIPPPYLKVEPEEKKIITLPFMREKSEEKEEAVQQMTLPYMRSRKLMEAEEIKTTEEEPTETDTPEVEVETEVVEERFSTQVTVEAEGSFSYFTAPAAKEEASAADVVLEAHAIVAAVLGEAQFISSFDSHDSTKLLGAELVSVVTEEEVDVDRDDHLFDEPYLASTQEDESKNVQVTDPKMKIEEQITSAFESSGLTEEEPLENEKAAVSQKTEDVQEDLGEVKGEMVLNMKLENREVQGMDHHRYDIEEKKEKTKESNKFEERTLKNTVTWNKISISTTMTQKITLAPMSPAEDKVKLMELKMMMEKMERMVDMLEEEMKGLQMRMTLDLNVLVRVVCILHNH